MADLSYQSKIYEKQGGAELVVASGGKLTVESGGIVDIQTGATVYFASNVQNVRKRLSIAQVNAGIEILPAVSGKAYRLVGCTAIAVGGAAGAVTTVDVLGTQSTSSVKLVAYAQANLTQSTVLRDGGTGAAVLADGASYVACDANTNIQVSKTGSAVTTATSIDINISYVIE